MFKRFGVVLLLSSAVLAQAETNKVDGVVDTVYDLQSLFKEHQETYLPVSPPSEEVFVQDYGLVVPFRTTNLPKKFLKRMVGELNADLIPLYRLSVYEDPYTRETVFLNVNGFEMFRIAPAMDYDPLSWQTLRFNLTETTTLDAWTSWVFDPAHIAADFTLVPEVFYADYMLLETQSLLAQDGGIMALEFSGPPPPPANTNTASTNVTTTTTNSLVTWHFPIPFGFGNYAEIFQCTNLINPSWDIAENRMAVTGGTTQEWSDVASSNFPMRFYILNDAEIDTDKDGYSDGREHYVEGTDPGIFDWRDSDSDGLHDWFETMWFGNITNQSGTNDFDGDTLINADEMELTSSNVIFHSDPTLLDSDGDGMDDAYESLYSFLDALDPADANQDWDQDGTSNLDEHDNNTDPSDFQDGGDTNVMSLVTLTVGNFPGQYGYYYDMTLTYSNQEIKVSCHAQGESVTKTVMLRKGTTYAVKLKRTWPPDGCGISRKYIARIEGANVVIPESTAFLGDHTESDTLIDGLFDYDDIALGSVHILSIEKIPLGGSADLNKLIIGKVYVPTKWGGTLSLGGGDMELFYKSEGAAGGVDLDDETAIEIYNDEFTDYRIAQGNAITNEVLENQHGWYYVKVSSEEKTTISASFVQTGEAATRPWNGYYWPIDSASINRLHSTNGTYRPLQKYDSVYGTNTRQEEADEVATLVANGQGGGFSGHCNGWSMASIMLPEPSAVTHGGVVFSEVEMKGLYTELASGGSGGSYVYIDNVGAGPPSDTLGEVGLDNNIAEIHVDLRTLIRGKKIALCSNMRPERTEDGPGTEIWNHAIYKYVSTYAEADGGDEHVLEITTTLFSNYDYEILPNPSESRTDVYVYVLEYDTLGFINGNSDKLNWKSASGYALKNLIELKAAEFNWQGAHCVITKENVDALDNN